MNWVCISGTLIPSAEAKISVWDHGLLYGDGLFETMRAYNGKILGVDLHLARLRKGAEIMRLNIKYDNSTLESLINQTIAANNLLNAYIRLTYTRGEGPIGLDPDLCNEGNLIIMAKESNVPGKTYELGLELGICPVVRNSSLALPPAIKSLNFLNNIFAKLWAKDQGFAEAVLLNHQGFLAETTVSNIFFVRGTKIFTPSLDSGILAGVTRQLVIEAAANHGTTVIEGLFTPEQLFTADEVFLTNSGSEVIPVSSVDKVPIGDGKPGKVTKSVHQWFKELIVGKLRRI